jgi:hypothetical protein
VYDINTYERVQKIDGKYNKCFNFNDSKLLCTFSPSLVYDIDQGGVKVLKDSPVQIEHQYTFNWVAKLSDTEVVMS